MSYVSRSERLKRDALRLPSLNARLDQALTHALKKDHGNFDLRAARGHLSISRDHINQFRGR